MYVSPLPSPVFDRFPSEVVHFCPLCIVKWLACSYRLLHVGVWSPILTSLSHSVLMINMLWTCTDCQLKWKPIWIPETFRSTRQQNSVCNFVAMWSLSSEFLMMALWENCNYSTSMEQMPLLSKASVWSMFHKCQTGDHSPLISCDYKVPRFFESRCSWFCLRLWIRKVIGGYRRPPM